MPDQPKPTDSQKTFYLDMCVQDWSALKADNGIALSFDSAGPCGFIPVFRSLEDAKKWSGENLNLKIVSTQ